MNHFLLFLRGIHCVFVQIPILDLQTPDIEAVACMQAQTQSTKQMICHVQKQ